MPTQIKIEREMESGDGQAQIGLFLRPYKEGGEPNTVQLIAKDSNGKIWSLLKVGPEGISLSTNIGLEVGLPLDPKGRVQINW